MDKESLKKAALLFLENSKENYLSKENAMSKELIGMKIFDTPILGFAAADDVYFDRLKQSAVIGEHFLNPKEWLPQANTVISFFLPFSQEVTSGNSRDMIVPSSEWLHGRIEGQAFLNKLSLYLKSQLINSGYQSVVPSLDHRFSLKKGRYSSNWSERHVAFICGLGTFGLSKGFITSKGMAGRLSGIITELDLRPDKRKYKEIYQYCSMCGKCITNCPVNAISMENGKNHDICSDFLDKTREKYKPRYGCGKCQVDVPCQNNIPNNNR